MFVCVLCVYLLQREKKEKRAGYKRKEEDERKEYVTQTCESLHCGRGPPNLAVSRVKKKKKLYLNPKLLVQKSSSQDNFYFCGSDETWRFVHL